MKIFKSPEAQFLNKISKESVPNVIGDLYPSYGVAATMLASSIAQLSEYINEKKMRDLIYGLS